MISHCTAVMVISFPPTLIMLFLIPQCYSINHRILCSLCCLIFNENRVGVSFLHKILLFYIELEVNVNDANTL